MVTKEHDVIIKAPNGGHQAKPCPTVLALLTTPLEAGVARYIHEQKLERYRQVIAESHLALTRHRIRHNELLKQLLDEDLSDLRSRIVVNIAHFRKYALARGS
jgi:hypothetical protein